jgi:hypothetical protein
MVVAVIVITEDWSPWIALVRIWERWPGLRFELKVEYLEELRPRPRQTVERSRSLL